MVASFLLTTGLVTLLATSVAGAKRKCQNITVPVTISARTGVFGNYAVPLTNTDAVTVALNITRQGANATADALTGYATTSGTFNIMATYCQPSKKANGTSVQLMTHGIGFDRTYWDLPFNNYNYSYVNSALAAGYDTVTYDRLGLGQSYHANTSVATRDQIQSFIEIAALAELTKMLRNGTFPSVATKYEKIIHVGHSFGSAQTYGLTAMYPTISDGIILTGFSVNSSFVPLFGAGANFVQANINQPLRFGSAASLAAINTFSETYGLTDLITPVDVTTIQPLNYVSGYLTNANANSGTYLFLFPGHFDPKIGYFAEQVKQPVTLGELLTLGSVPTTNAFAKPVLVFTGQMDLPYCGGNCLATGGAMASVPAGVQKAFPKASKFEAYIQPESGHGLTFHYNATAGYQYIQSWLASSGLAA